MKFYFGWRFYKGAYHALRGGAGNMDVLVTLGTSVAYIYSVVLMLQGRADVYFNTSAMIAAIESLAKLGAKVAHVLRD